MTILAPAQLIEHLNHQAGNFAEVMATIEHHYHFQPTRFVNGSQINEAGQNNGSCKIFAFAQLHQLSEQATLNAFGDYYTQDVLGHPEGKDHSNIRNFMQQGWQGIQFDQTALTAKNQS